MIALFDGRDIAALREKLGMTPTAFAALLGVSASAVCLWEKGQRVPRTELMVKLNQLAKKQGMALA